MKFIQGSANRFKKLSSKNAEFYYAGDLDSKTWRDFFDDLDGGYLDLNIRGNFAFVYISDKRVTAFVDHICNYPLFYTDEYISDNYGLIESTVENPKDDIENFWRRRFLGQVNYDESTRVEGVSRIKQCHYYENGKQYHYLDLFKYKGDQDLDKEYFADLVETEFLNEVEENNVLLISAGTDSTTLAAIAKKLGVLDKFKLLHIYSNKVRYTEVPQIDAVAKDMDLDIIKYHYSKIHSIDEVRESNPSLSYWFDRPWLSKEYALNDLGFSTYKIFNGEVGDQLFGGPKTSAELSYALQATDFNPAMFGRLWMHLAANAGENTNYFLHQRLRDRFEDDKLAERIYHEIEDKFAELWWAMETDDLMNRILLYNLYIKGPLRVFSNTQNTFNNVSIFSKWKVVEYALQLKSKYKIYDNGTLKYIFLDTWRDYLSPLPWTLSKSGPGMR